MNRNALWSALCIIGMLMWLAAFYGSSFLALDDFLFSASGDGLKNYFTYAWHVQHDTDLLSFQGSNYPYGEHVIYTDGHPLLSWLFQLIPAASPWAIGILHMTLFLGPVICAVLMYRVGRRSGLQEWRAMLLAIAIAALQPQLGRMGGHFALAHCWAIPLGWYAILHLRAAAFHWRWVLVWNIVGLTLFFTHPYLGIMVVAFGLLFLLAHHFMDVKVALTTLSVRAFWIALPAVMFKVFVSLTDHHVDRPDMPAGNFEFASGPAAVFLPSGGALRHLFNGLVGEGDQNWEGLAYIGIITTLLLLMATGSWLVIKVRKQESVRLTSELNASLFAAIILLLFSFGYPFRWTPWLQENLPLVGQFRSVGRFAWPFYFVIILWVGTWWAKWLQPPRFRRVVAMVLWCLLPFSLLVEAHRGHTNLEEQIAAEKNLFQQEALPLDMKELVDAIKGTDVDAIIPLPYYMGGPDAYMHKEWPMIKERSLLAAYHTGIPVMAGIATRTSLQEGRAWLSLLVPTYFERSIRDDLDPNAQFMIYWSREDLDRDERAFV